MVFGLHAGIQDVLGARTRRGRLSDWADGRGRGSGRGETAGGDTAGEDTTGGEVVRGEAADEAERELPADEAAGEATDPPSSFAFLAAAASISF